MSGLDNANAIHEHHMRYINKNTFKVDKNGDVYINGAKLDKRYTGEYEIKTCEGFSDVKGITLHFMAFVEMELPNDAIEASLI